jgi:hypothetical protein
MYANSVRNITTINPSPKKNYLFKKRFKEPRTWTDSLERLKQLKNDMRFGTWNVRSLYRVDSIKSAVGELEKCKLDLVEVQEVR